MQILIVELRACLPKSLGAIHSKVGVAQNIVGTGIGRGARCNANASACVNRLPVDEERDSQSLLNPIGNPDRVTRIDDCGYQDRKLISASRASVSLQCS